MAESRGCPGRGSFSRNTASALDHQAASGIQGLGRNLDSHQGLLNRVLEGELDLGTVGPGRTHPLAQIGDDERKVVAHQGNGGREIEARPQRLDRQGAHYPGQGAAIGGETVGPSDGNGMFPQGQEQAAGHGRPLAAEFWRPFQQQGVQGPAGPLRNDEVHPHSTFRISLDPTPQADIGESPLQVYGRDAVLQGLDGLGLGQGRPEQEAPRETRGQGQFPLAKLPVAFERHGAQDALGPWSHHKFQEHRFRVRLGALGHGAGMRHLHFREALVAEVGRDAAVSLIQQARRVPFGAGQRHQVRQPGLAPQETQSGKGPGSEEHLGARLHLDEQYSGLARGGPELNTALQAMILDQVLAQPALGFPKGFGGPSGMAQAQARDFQERAPVIGGGMALDPKLADEVGFPQDQLDPEMSPPLLHRSPKGSRRKSLLAEAALPILQQRLEPQWSQPLATPQVREQLLPPQPGGWLTQQLPALHGPDGLEVDPGAPIWP